MSLEEVSARSRHAGGAGPGLAGAAPSNSGVRVRKRVLRLAASDAQRTRNRLRKRTQALLRLNYSAVATAVVLPLLAFGYLAHQKQALVPENVALRCFCVVYYNITMLAFTAGYHKCYAHLTFRPTTGLVHAFFCVFGASLGLGPAREWAALHRAHHQYTDDTEKDPYLIKRGVWWAHYGWLLEKSKTGAFHREFIRLEFPDEATAAASEPEPAQLPALLDTAALDNTDFDALEAQLGQYEKIDRGAGNLAWILWQEPLAMVFFVLTLVVLPAAVSVAVCHDTAVNGVVYAGLLRMYVCQQLVLSTELLCHLRGLHVTVPLQPFNDKNSLVNCANPLVALLTYGQALQNFHHEFPHDYRVLSLYWSIDPTKWFIYLLLVVGLADNLAKAPLSLVMQLKIQQQQLVLNRMRSQLNWGTPISKLPHITTREFRRLVSSAEDRIYIVIQNIIHDITPFMDQHPGGLPLLRASHGKDATKAFYGGVYGHLTAAVNLLATMRIGVLDVGDDEGVWSRMVREESNTDGGDRHESLYRTAEAA